MASRANRRACSAPPPPAADDETAAQYMSLAFHQRTSPPGSSPSLAHRNTLPSPPPPSPLQRCSPRIHALPWGCQKNGSGGLRCACWTCTPKEETAAGAGPQRTPVLCVILELAANRAVGGGRGGASCSKMHFDPRRMCTHAGGAEAIHRYRRPAPLAAQCRPRGAAGSVKRRFASPP